MEYILDMLNKIKWDTNENPQDYTILYYDRIKHRLRELKFTKIKKFETIFLLVEKEGEEINIPMHRIREIRKKGQIIWKR